MAPLFRFLRRRRADLEQIVPRERTTVPRDRRPDPVERLDAIPEETFFVAGPPGATRVRNIPFAPFLFGFRFPFLQHSHRR